jgi:hypothetical protein
MQPHEPSPFALVCVLDLTLLVRHRRRELRD